MLEFPGGDPGVSWRPLASGPGRGACGARGLLVGGGWRRPKSTVIRYSVASPGGGDLPPCVVPGRGGVLDGLGHTGFALVPSVPGIPVRPCATSRCKVTCGAGVSVWSGNTRGVHPRRDNSPASEPVSVCSRGDPWAIRLPLVGGGGGGAVVCGRSFRKALGHFLKSHRVRPSPHRECG